MNPTDGINLSAGDSALEIDLLLEAIFKKCGYDFRNYSREHIVRRLFYRMENDGLKSISQLQHHVLHSPKYAAELIEDLSINVTEMFRDPLFFKSIREQVIPVLKTWSFVKIWHAGCSTGEEVYSMAILLKEEGLYDRVNIYATDFSSDALNKAKEGIYSAEKMKKYAQNYRESGATGTLSDYFHAKYDSAIVDNSLKKNIIWAHHNLVTDSDFTEAHMVVCRNVLIYFNKDLQNKVYGTFDSSLVGGGFLCLGNRENIRFSEYEKEFSVVNNEQRIYKKRYSLP